MQQTRVEQGMDYYLKFIRLFPTVQSLASASLDEVMRHWQGLGYYTRARNLHKAAKYIGEELKGNFPDTYEGLLSLPGIGPYSAAAIASFAFGKKHVVVDGNVKRVIARFAGIKDPVADKRTHDRIHAIASESLNGNSPALFNQAIMNFGALMCKPSGALCTGCPLSKKCYAYQHDLVSSIPFRIKKKENRIRYFHFVIFHQGQKIFLQLRDDMDIWKGLYAPPVIETKSARRPSVAKINTLITNDIEENTVLISSSTHKQILSHQTIIGRFHHIQIPAGNKLDVPGKWVTKRTIQHFGKPEMVTRNIEHFFDTNMN
jgi:A/G-specific adenine glycosylase